MRESFFHGTLEIIDRDTPVTVFLGEDAERPLAERVANFLPRICGNFTLIDSRDYELAVSVRSIEEACLIW